MFDLRSYPNFGTSVNYTVCTPKFIKAYFQVLKNFGNINSQNILSDIFENILYNTLMLY